MILEKYSDRVQNRCCLIILLAKFFLGAMLYTKSEDMTKKIWAVGGGKGGVGKTVFTANLAVSLAKGGKKVVVVDLDLGGANIHTVLGVKHIEHTLGDFLVKKKFKNIADIAVKTPIDNLRLISGSNGILELANPSFAQKMKMVNGLNKLEADVVLLDLGAGTSFDILDFFNLADIKIMVACPEPTSIQNAYGFIKSAIYRKIVREFFDNPLALGILKRNNKSHKVKPLGDLREYFSGISENVAKRYDAVFDGFSPNIVMNMVRREEEKSMAHGISLVSKKFLNVNMRYIGHVYMDAFVMDSVQNMLPFLLLDNKHRVSQCVLKISNEIVEREFYSCSK